MLCPICQTSIQNTFDALYIPGDPTKETRYSETKVFHHTPYSLYRSVVIGCFICQNVWLSDLKARNGLVNNYLQEALEGNVPGTYEEFCDQYGSIEYSMKSTFSIAELTRPHNEDWRRGEPWISFLAGWMRTNYCLLFSAGSKPLLYIRLDQLLQTYGLAPSRHPQVEVSSLSTNNSIDLWQYWLRTCLGSHVQCRVPSQRQRAFVPDRLIEILNNGNENHIEWRLVLGKDVGVVPYFTLSHCWGTSRHLELRVDNYSELLEASADTCLPKTYQEAFRVTASLGYRYIWIDSLCIIQDVNDDWRAQSSNMGLIYSNACCNIAATWAKDGAGGLFTKSRPRDVRPVIRSISRDDRRLYYQISSLPDPRYHEDITFAPLNQRAWVVQERYLSRRQLSFAKRQAYWECFELSASEQYPDGTPFPIACLRFDLDGIRTGQPRDKPSIEVPRSVFPKAWRALVELYSNCDISRKSDKLIALAGLAGELWKNTAATDEYLAGLWKKNLINQLCWRADEGRRNRSRISPYIAPTWSWASLDSPVVSDVHYYLVKDPDYPGHPVILGEVVEACVDSDHNTKLHSFTGSKLILRGIAMRAHAIPMSQLTHPTWDYELRFGDKLEMAPVRVEIFWDEHMPDSDARSDYDRWTCIQENRTQELLFQCVSCEIETRPQGKSFESVCGLVLRMSPVSIGRVSTYVRMGIFRTTHDSLAIHVAKRLGFQQSDNKLFFREDKRGEYVNFKGLWNEHNIKPDDARLAGLIHEVTII